MIGTTAETGETDVIVTMVVIVAMIDMMIDMTTDGMTDVIMIAMMTGGTETGIAMTIEIAMTAETEDGAEYAWPTFSYLCCSVSYSARKAILTCLFLWISYQVDTSTFIAHIDHFTFTVTLYH